MWTRTVIAAVAIAIVGAVAPASAETYKFRYRAHELQTDGGRASLMARLDAQVDSYCAVDDGRGIHTQRAANACKQEVKSEIVSKIQNAAFARLQ